MKKFIGRKLAGAILAASLLWAPSFGVVDAAAMPDKTITAETERVLSDLPMMLGYPMNEDIKLEGFYKWYIKSGLSKLAMNNAGSPYDVPHGAFQMMKLEREVMDFFAPFYGFTKDEAWGLISNGGTDGNNHGIYFGAKSLQSETGQLPVVYVSEESHYSNKRLADLQNLEVRLIKCNEWGDMIPEDFEEKLDPERPALVVYSIGTTFKGGVDDQATLNKVLEKVKPVAVYRHVDAALFGGYLPFTEYKGMVDRRVQPFDSIAISGHKFFGVDSPCGLFFTTKKTLEKQKGYNPGYLATDMPMISCSRSTLNPMKFYWIVKEMGEEGFREQAASIMENTKYLKARMDEMGWPAWLRESSNTVFFKQPSEHIMHKYTLAPEFDERFGGKLAHVVVMQHCDRKLLDEFLKDLAAEMKK